MLRLKEYAQFAVWFAGLGYVVLWPLIALDLDNAGAGNSVLCQLGTAAISESLCQVARPLALPPPLHVAGMLAAVLVSVQLLMAGLRMARERQAAASGPTQPIKPPPLSRRFQRPVAKLKPRTQFGLRGRPPPR